MHKRKGRDKPYERAICTGGKAIAAGQLRIDLAGCDGGVRISRGKDALARRPRALWSGDGGGSPPAIFTCSGGRCRLRLLFARDRYKRLQVSCGGRLSKYDKIFDTPQIQRGQFACLLRCDGACDGCHNIDCRRCGRPPRLANYALSCGRVPCGDGHGILHCDGLFGRLFKGDPQSCAERNGKLHLPYRRSADVLVKYKLRWHLSRSDIGLPYRYCGRSVRRRKGGCSCRGKPRLFYIPYRCESAVARGCLCTRRPACRTCDFARGCSLCGSLQFVHRRIRPAQRKHGGA